MNRAVPITVSIIALCLLGVGVFWWLQDERKTGSAVYVNREPEFSETTEEEEATESALAVDIEEEIEQLEAAKAEEFAAPTPASLPTSVPEQATPQAKNVDIKNRLVDWGYAVPKTPRSIDTVVLHSSYNSLGGDEYSVEKIIAIYKDYGVSAHYIIDRKGTIYRLVEDKNISYHAGASKMPDGRQNVNDFSIGIELVNDMEDQYTSAQYDAVNDLIEYLDDRHGIKHVVGHSDIAPSRKTDPWNFDWKELK